MIVGFDSALFTPACRSSNRRQMHNYGDTFGSTASLFDVNTGLQVGTLRPPLGAEGSFFGWSVDMYRSIAAVGSFQWDGDLPSFVYLFDVSNPSRPVEFGRLASNDPRSYYLGWSVAMDGDRVVSGTNWDDGNEPESGTAYSWSLSVCGLCPADWNGDGVISTLDVIAFLSAWAAGDSAADFNRDGTIDTRDVLAFLNSWVGGC